VFHEGRKIFQSPPKSIDLITWAVYSKCGFDIDILSSEIQLGFSYCLVQSAKARESAQQQVTSGQRLENAHSSFSDCIIKQISSADNRQQSFRTAYIRC
jgi:hypothetical protein